LKRLLDIQKVAGASAEMYWQGAFPGLSIETQPQLAGLVEVDLSSIDEQMSKWAEGMQRYFVTENLSVKSLAPQVSDPTPQITQLLTLICSTIRVPLRIFLGAEAGHLASSQDKDTWNGRLAARQNYYITPLLIKPFINRLVEHGILPKPEKIMVKWTDLNSWGLQELADVGMKRAQSLLQYVTSGSETVMTFRNFLLNCWMLSPEQADAMIADGTTARKLLTEKLWDSTLQQTGLGNISDPTNKTGAGGKRNNQG
jgi:hypothetical protein